LYLGSMIDEIVQSIARCRNCAVLTGAGISAESGVPTFRGDEGLWRKFRPEELATMSAFMDNPKLVWEWYNWRRELIGEVKPNPGHYALAQMEELFDSFTLITQNVDGLHIMAGSGNLLEVHGNIYRNKCRDCEAQVSQDEEIDPDNIPACEKCGGQIRPDVVWFGEMLNPEVINGAFAAAEQSDLFLSIGTSGVVHPAASLPVAAKQNGATLVEINPEQTPLTGLANFYVAGPSGEILPPIVEALKQKRNEG